jgi:hypothetical protein
MDDPIKEFRVLMSDREDGAYYLIDIKLLTKLMTQERLDRRIKAFTSLSSYVFIAVMNK